MVPSPFSHPVRACCCQLARSWRPARRCRARTAGTGSALYAGRGISSKCQRRRGSAGRVSNPAAASYRENLGCSLWLQDVLFVYAFRVSESFVDTFEASPHKKSKQANKRAKKKEEEVGSEPRLERAQFAFRRLAGLAALCSCLYLIAGCANANAFDSTRMAWL